jgi:hypothetical protein
VPWVLSPFVARSASRSTSGSVRYSACRHTSVCPRLLAECAGGYECPLVDAHSEDHQSRWHLRTCSGQQPAQICPKYTEITPCSEWREKHTVVVCVCVFLNMISLMQIAASNIGDGIGFGRHFHSVPWLGRICPRL